jgi:predicted Zn-dependent protease
MKKVISILAVAATVGLLCLWFYGRPAYQRHKETRAITLARTSMARGDYRNASVSARQAYQLNPRNLEACRIMAEVCEVSRSPSVLDWRRRAAELAPNVENKLALATSALRAQGAPYPLAAQTLEELGGSATNLTAYHVVSAELALKLNRMSAAATHYDAASRLEPTNESHRLNLAVLRLRSTNGAIAADARATLEQLCQSTNVGAAALRWMVVESLRQNDLPAAQRFSTRLLADPHGLPEDRLQHLAILQKAGGPEFATYLTTVQKSSVTNATAIYGVSTWMIGHGLVTDAMRWLSNCPPRVQAEQPVPVAFVDGFLAKKDWAGLDSFLADKKWGDLEFLRFAFLSRAASEQKQDRQADTRWRTAVREAGDRLGPLTTLLGLATNWRQDKAKEDLLWQIAQRFPRERWALRELERHYLADGNTRGLNKVYAALASYDAKDFRLQNNVAATSLLLKANLSQAHEMAKELYAGHPEEAFIVSTYAYSLHLQGRTREGLAALEKLKAESLESPQVALYYGVLLAAAGETSKAGRYLSIAQRENGLPEEKALLAAARTP